MKITIITINYNNDLGLVKTFNSINLQIIENFTIEYVVIDGCSSDNSCDFIKNYKFDSTYVEYKYLIEKDRGISDAFNKGLSLVNGDYVLMLNSGDIFNDKSSLNAVVDIMAKENVEADCYFGKVLLNGLGGAVGGEGLNIPHQGAFIKNDCYKKIGGYDERFKIRMDYDFFSRFKKLNRTVKYMDVNVARFEVGGVSNDIRNRANFYFEGMLVDIRDKNINFFRNLTRFLYHKIRR
jgi:glycosyltransferase involved in cell wall biosynthesis